MAALLVVGFHYTTQYEKFYGHAQSPWGQLPWGYYGVNLFFMISGFVIFMTLDATRRPTDFLVSRFSRLYPAYWTAICLTFVVTHTLSLPGKMVDPQTALLNLTMVHGFFGVPHVDNVYWTLQVELIFYGLAFLLYLNGLLSRVFPFLWLWLFLRVLYFVLGRYAGIDLPWIVYSLLDIEFMPWFAIGIAVYFHRSGPPQRRPLCVATALAALVVIAIVESFQTTAFSIAFAALFAVAASGRVRFLRFAPLVWVGTISYPLYLIHENAGWALLRRLEIMGIPANAAILITTFVALAVAAVITYLIEKPAMSAIRGWFRARHAAVGATT